MAVKELTVGNPLKLILSFMFPIFIGNIFQQLYNLVDALIVGRVLGLKALAAVGATGPLIFLVISFIFASTQGFTVVTAHKFGAKQYDLVKKSFVSSLILSGLLMVILTLISTPFTYQLLGFLRTPADIINLSGEYLYIMFVGIFATVFYNVSSNTIRALGDSKTPLYFLIFGTVINIFFDLLFIVKFHMGISGAAWATVLSQGISTIFCMAYMFLKFPILRFNRYDFNVSKSFLYEHIKIGIPMGFQMSVLSLGIMVLQYVLNSFGANAIAAFTTAMRIDQFFSQAFLALGATMAVFTAQNFGAKNTDRIKQGARIAVCMVLAISTFSIIVVSLFSTQMIGWFMSEYNEEVMQMAKLYLQIIVFSFVFLGILFVFRNILQGMGNVTAPLVSSVAELVARASCAVIFAYYFGYLGICIATPAAWIAGSMVLFIGYKISIKIQQKNMKNLAG